MKDHLHAAGRFGFYCHDRSGWLRWQRKFSNVVVTVGKNLALDTYLAGIGYTVTGPFMGLIGSTGFTIGPQASDTMASHPGWQECGLANDPHYTGPRPTVTWNAAGSGIKVAVNTAFGILTTGTLEGGFIVFGPGAVSSIDSTAGVLYSAGTFTGGSALVGNGDTVTVTYQTSL